MPLSQYLSLSLSLTPSPPSLSLSQSLFPSLFFFSSLSTIRMTMGRHLWKGFSYLLVLESCFAGRDSILQSEYTWICVVKTRVWAMPGLCVGWLHSVETITWWPGRNTSTALLYPYYPNFILFYSTMHVRFIYLLKAYSPINRTGSP